MYSNLTLEHQLCFALYSASNTIVQAYRPKLAKVGLTYSQYLVMLSLWQHGAMRAGDVAAQIGLEPATVTPMLKRMEAAGVIRRQRSDIDGRILEISLTEHGEELQHDVAMIQQQVECESGLNEETLISLRRQLHDLAETFRRQNTTTH